MRSTLLLLLLLATASCSTTSPDRRYDAYFNNLRPALLDGLGPSGHPIDSTAPHAQAWFDQGVALCWGYNQPEAVRAFQQIINADPQCAIAYWGIAYALGPSPFYPQMSDDQARRAHRAAQEALARVGGATDVERALIVAMATRYEIPQPDDRAELNVAYADAMRDAYQRFPDNALVGTLCADAILNSDDDWGNWGTDAEKGPYAIEVIEILEDVMSVDPEYAGAHHFYIHVVESSDRPERGLGSANRLQTLMPGAGHLVHTSGHIYMRLGMYDETITANQRAIEADNAYFRSVPESVSPYYDLRAHNHHFLIWAAMFRGSYALSISAARDMIRDLPKESDYPWVGYYRFVPTHVLIRFGRWEDILTEPHPIVDETSVALWHHARAIAYANLGRLEAARQEAEAFEDASQGHSRGCGTGGPTRRSACPGTRDDVG